MTSSKFTGYYPGSNKVHYPISGRNDFTVLLTSVVDRQNYIIEKSPHFTIHVFSLKISFVNKNKSTGICRLVQINK